jgi:MFS family permease
MSAGAQTLQRLPRRAFAIIFGVSLATALGNTGMISVLPAIGRSLRIPDFLVSAIFSLSAFMWAFSSPFWARLSDQKGRKPLMLVGLTGFMVSMIACGTVVSAGLRGFATPLIVFGLFLLARALFGLFGAASNPATQAYVAEGTAREHRTQAMASLAGAFGLGTVIGPFVAPLFILPVVGLAGPMFGFATIAAAMLAVVQRFLPESPGAAQAARDLIARTMAEADGKRMPLWRDARLIPFLVYGFVLATIQTAQAQTLGFLIIDKLRLSPTQAQGFIAVAMMFGAVAGLLAQWGIIRMFEMGPRLLLRWGVAVALVGNLIVAVSPDYWTVVIGYAISSLGFGLARPGFTAGASLAVRDSEQADAAGAIAAVNGVNVVLAPLFVLLYGAFHPAPFLLSAGVLGGLMVYALASAALRNAGEAPATEEDTTQSTLERSDEGGV